MERTVREQRSFKLEYRIVLSNREVRFIAAQGEVISDRSGLPLRVHGTVLDITERKRVEEELRQAKLNAEAALKVKSEFLAKMSHEVRTPMNAILGFTDIMLEEGLSAEHREYLGMIRSSGDALLGIIDSILDFSKYESGAVVIESAPFEVRKTVAKVVELLRLQAEQKHLALTCSVEPETPPIFVGDAGRVRQVLINLIGNSLKFTERGSIDVQVAPASNQAVPGMLEFTVRDTGVGIPANQQRAIFEAFVQADNSTTRRFGGTGLGLAISSQLVTLMGGRIWVESEPGKGSTFHFTIRPSGSPRKPV